MNHTEAQGSLCKGPISFTLSMGLPGVLAFTSSCIVFQCSYSRLVVCRSDASGHLGGEHVKSTRSSILHQGLQDRNVVAQGLATGCGSRHHHIPASQNGVDGLRLVGEHLGDASYFDGGLHWL